LEPINRGKQAFNALISLAVRDTAWKIHESNRKMGARMVEKKAPRGQKNPIRDRVQFLTMMSPRVIKAIKKAALQRNQPAWVIMEEAAQEWLDRQKNQRGT
jgi:hypothetical protein